MKNDSPLRFEYKASARALILLMVVAIVFTVVMAHIAQTNASPPLTGPLALIIPPSAMPIIDWGLSAFFCLLTIFLFYGFLKQSNAVNYIELGPNGALVQIKSVTMSMSQVTIPYQSIRSIQVNTVKKHKRVVISSSVGDTLLDSRCFSTPSDFTAFLLALEQRRHGYTEVFQPPWPPARKDDSHSRFEYKASAWDLIPLIVASSVATAYTGYDALNMSANIRLTNEWVQLISSSAIPAIYWGLTAYLGHKTIKLLITAIKISNGGNYVELGPNSALVPSLSFSKSPITIPYQSITSVQVNTVQKHKMVAISSSVGEALLDSRYFSTPSDFTAFLSTLDQRRQG